MDKSLVDDAHRHALDSFLSQCLGFRVCRVSCDTPKLEFLGCLGVAEDRLDDRTPLIASGPEDDENLLCRHDVGGRWVKGLFVD